MRGATSNSIYSPYLCGHFNPHSPCGERPFFSSSVKSMFYFNPHSPCGERLPHFQLLERLQLFQSTLPMRGATVFRYKPHGNFQISIHTPHAGSDYLHFNLKFFFAISIHTPHAGSDSILTSKPHNPKISIHTPHAGSDLQINSSVESCF